MREDKPATLPNTLLRLLLSLEQKALPEALIIIEASEIWSILYITCNAEGRKCILTANLKCRQGSVHQCHLQTPSSRI